MSPDQTQTPKITLSTISDISTRTKWLVSKRYTQATLVIVLMTLAVAVPFITRTLAFVTDVGNAGVFELDGNIVKNSGGAFPTDWGALFSPAGVKLALPTGGVDSGWTDDGPHSVLETTTFTTGSKDTLDIANGGWQCTGTNNLTPKDDILHAYSFAIRPTSGPRMGHLLIYGGFERFANNGAGDLGYWLLADPTVACSTSGATISFSGAHTIGDLLIVGEFSTGGSVTTLSVVEWTGAGPCATPAGPNLCLITTPGNADCQLASSGDNVCARVNVASQSPITTPWATQDKTSGANLLATAEFFEVGLDITNLLPSSSGCFNKFLFDTRTSPSTTATLKDYAEGVLVTCPNAHISTNVAPSPIALGGSATDTATVTLTQAAGTVNGTVTFNVYGPFSSAPSSTSCTPATLITPFSPNTKNIGPGVTPQSVTSDPFTPTLPGYYGWIATYNPASLVNGNIVSTTCGDAGETLVVISASISTTVSPSTITFGGSATDTATVTLTPGTATVSGTVDFRVFGPVATSTPTCTTLAGSFLSVPIGPGVSPQSATSGSFTPSATGFYFWTATYNPAGAANGNMVSTTCGDAGETLQVVSIPKITGFDFTNTPTNNDPTLGSGTVVYTFTIHNFGATPVTLGGSLTVSGTASVSCTGGNTLTLSGSLAAGANAPFSLTCTYGGTSGQNVQATINAMFTDLNGVTGTVSGSPTTYIFTIQRA